MGANGDLVLLTGATGFLGYKILVDLIKAGYSVRLAVRSPSKLPKIVDSPSVKALNPSAGQITSVIVPDMAVDGAYDEAVKGVKYIVHVAAPIPTFGGPNPPEPAEYESYFVKPAVAGVVGMLESAAKEPAVKRVIMTSSTVAITPFEYYLGQGSDPARVFTSADRIPVAPAPYSLEFEAYSAAKAAALNASEAWMAEHKPGFDLVSILPGWIFGRDELATDAASMTAESTNSVLLGFLRGGQSDVPFNGNAVEGDDVAHLHVLALDTARIPGSRAYVASIDFNWETAHEVLRRDYADAVAAGKVSLEGKQGTLDVLTTAEDTEAIFGVKLRPYEAMVKGVVDRYLEVSA